MTEINIDKNIQSQEALPPLDIPTISVDRALGHMFEHVAIDTDALSSFYESLPHENKRPLSELKIHFSATALKDDTLQEDGMKYGTITTGSLIWRGTKGLKSLATPELPVTDTPTIMVYVGSRMSSNDIKEINNDELPNQLSRTVTHELTHYAQGPQFEDTLKTDFISRAKRQVWRATSAGLGLFIDTRWLKAGASTAVASEVLSDNSLPSSLKLALGSAALMHIAGSRKRHRNNAQRRHNAYLEDPKEADAHHHQIPLVGLVDVSMPHTTTEVIENITLREDKKMRKARRLAKTAHRELALAPRVLDK